jgi:hypothetical protein
MKQLIYTVLLSFVATTANAQTEDNACKISFATTVGTGLPIMNAPSSMSFAWQVLGYCHLTERWSVGAGTGLSFYEKTSIPVFGDVKFQIGKTQKFTPYTELGMGYSFTPASDANGGFFMNPSVGILYPLKNRMKLQLALGYELQALERLKTQTDSYFSKEFVEKLSHHSVSVRLGFVF